MSLSCAQKLPSKKCGPVTRVSSVSHVKGRWQAIVYARTQTPWGAAPRRPLLGFCRIGRLLADADDAARILASGQTPRAYRNGMKYPVRVNPSLW